MIRYAIFMVLGCAVFIFPFGCKDSGTMPSTGTVSMLAKYTNTPPISGSSTMVPLSSSSGIDSIQVTQARFVLAKVKFDNEEEEADFKTGPFVLQLNLGGSLQNIAIAGVPFGAYDEVKFKVHLVDSSEVLAFSPADLSRFSDFLASGHYSMIIDGIIFRTDSSQQSFTFRSRENANQKNLLNPPLVVNSSNPTANVTLTVNSYGWFRNFSGGLVDPTDSLNRGFINENLEHSFKVFCDRDRDGRDDRDEDHSGDHEGDSSETHDGDGEH